LPISLPPLPEQAEIVRRVEALFAMADRIEARLTAARAQVERLTPATLSKAFCGDLVPQDPNDEPASKLLERLQSAPAPKTSRKR
jgi:type I restriction enzyme S subunit